MVELTESSFATQLYLNQFKHQKLKIITNSELNNNYIVLYDYRQNDLSSQKSFKLKLELETLRARAK